MLYVNKMERERERERERETDLNQLTVPYQSTYAADQGKKHKNSKEKNDLETKQVAISLMDSPSIMFVRLIIIVNVHVRITRNLQLIHIDTHN